MMMMDYINSVVDIQTVHLLSSLHVPYMHEYTGRRNIGFDRTQEKNELQQICFSKHKPNVGR